LAKKEIEEREKEKTEKPVLERAEQETPEHKEPLELASLRTELEEQKKMYLYLRADFENYKRNVNKERLELLARGEDNVLMQMFGLLELIERAITYAREHQIPQPVTDGLELVKREMSLTLEKFKVTKIPTQNQKFDPQIHEAIAVIEAQDMEPGAIVKEERPGFMREGRVLTPARVLVVKEPSESKIVH